MQHIIRYTLRWGIVLLLFAVMVGTTAHSQAKGAAVAPARAPSSARRATMAVTGMRCTPACDLYATTGTITLPGQAHAVPVWRYAATSRGAIAPPNGPATVPGPVIIANQGDTLTITLHNELNEATALSFPENGAAPDLTAVAAGAMRTYTFQTSSAGTFIYEAGQTGATGDVQHQVAMGLIGALIVRPPAPNQAYNGANSAYNDEALLVLSELDPALNTNANPAVFDMNTFAPKYWLINGQVYPNIPAISTAAGNKVLLRYVNAGVMDHSIGLLGLHQLVLANDGQPLTYPYKIVAETLTAGQTLDVIASISAAAPPGSKYPLYEAGMRLDNNGALSTPPASNPAYTPVASGGALTFLSISGTQQTGGPVTSAISLAPNPTNGQAAVTLRATITASGGATVNAAEYFVDTIGAPGSGCPIIVSPGNASATISVTIPPSGATPPCADLATLVSGTHTFFVRGQDTSGAGTWGAVVSAVLNLDKTGPVTNSISLTPTVTNGTANLTLSVTGDDTATGNQNVDQAEYFIDSNPPATVRGTALTQVTPPPPQLATQVSFNVTIPAATVNALAEGAHTIYIRSHDVLGNWGTFGSSALNVDKTGPTTSSTAITPNPNNGTLTYDINQFAVQVTATVSDPVVAGSQSNITAVESFIDTSPPVSSYGTGVVWLPNSGTFTTPSQGFSNIMPLYSVKALTQGLHTIYIHGQDAAGNWGALAPVTLSVDKTPPIVTSVSVTPNSATPTSSVSLFAAATDPPTTGTPANAPASNIVAAEYFSGADPGTGNGTAMTGTFGSPTVSNLSATIDVSKLAAQTYTIAVRTKDSAGNWSQVKTTTLTIVDQLFADGFDAGNFNAWTGTGGRIAVTAASRQSGTYGMQSTISSSISGYVAESTPSNLTSYHARFYFNPHGVTMPANSTNPETIFVGLNSSSQVVFSVQVQLTSTHVYQVRCAVSQANGISYTSYVPISNGYHWIEIAWQSAPAAKFRLYIDSTTAKQTLNALNTSSYTLNSVQLGPTSGLGGVAGTQYFDNFKSSRNTPIGP